jgi:hypothetical protein
MNPYYYPITLQERIKKILAFIFRFGYKVRQREFYGLADPAIEPLVVAWLT